MTKDGTIQARNFRKEISNQMAQFLVYMPALIIQHRANHLQYIEIRILHDSVHSEVSRQVGVCPQIDISDTFGLHDTSFNPVIGRSVMVKVYQKQTT